MSSILEEYKRAAKDLQVKIFDVDIQKYGRLKDPYSSYHQISTSLAVIARRIDSDLSKDLEVSGKVQQWIQKTGFAPPEQIMIEVQDSNSMLTLDIADLYIYTRILFDVLCMIIKLSYGKYGIILPNSMQDLVTSRKDRALSLDRAFFAPLFEKVAWFGNFRLQRDSIVHYFSHMRVMIDGSGKHLFQWAASEQSWDGIRDNSVEGFVNNTLSNLKETMEYLTSRLTFDGIKAL